MSPAPYTKQAVRPPTREEFQPIHVPNYGADFGTRLALSFAGNENEIASVLRQKYGSGNFGQITDTNDENYGKWVYRLPGEQVGGWRLIDERAITKQDLADMTGYLPEATLGTIGAILGFGVGGGIKSMVTAPIGAGLGAGAGEASRKAIGRAFFDIKTDKTLEDDLWDVAKAAARGSLFEIPFSGLQVALAPAAKQMTTAARGYKEAAREAGMRPLPSEVTGSRTVDLLEGALSNLWASSETMLNRFRGNLRAFSDYTKNEIGRIGKPTAGAVEAGQIAKGMMSDYVSAFRTEADAMFDSIGRWAHSQGMTVPLDDFVTKLNQFKTTDAYRLNPSMQTFVSRLEDVVLDPNTGAAAAMPFGPTAKDGIRYLRTHLRMLGDNPDIVSSIPKGTVQQFRKILDETIQNWAQNSGNRLFLEEFKYANAWYQAEKKLINSPLGKSLVKDPLERGMAAEKIVNIFKPGNYEQIRQLKTLVGPEAFEYLKNAYLQKQFSKFKVFVNDRGRLIFDTPDASKMVQWWKNWSDDDAYKLIFDAREQRHLGELIELASGQQRALKYVPKVESPGQQQLGGVIHAMSMLTKIGGNLAMPGVGAYMYGWRGALGGVVVPWMLAKFVTSRPGSAWLTYTGRGIGAAMAPPRFAAQLTGAAGQEQTAEAVQAILPGGAGTMEAIR